MKWPKIRIRRETIERTLIVCSAALVLLLSLKRGGTNGEPYEEPLEDIPQGEISEGMWIAGLEESYTYTGKAIKPGDER